MKTLGLKTITPEGTWFIHDMWCSTGEYCPMAVALFSIDCNLTSPKTGKTVVNESSVQNNGGNILYLTFSIVSLAVALMVGVIYYIGRKHGRGEVLKFFVNTKDIDKRR
jgi:hypothetical protein